MRLSIIIPIYNVEEYIEKCVQSLQQQDIPIKDYELIIINDGSPDDSREVILKLMQRFDNIVFIDQENKGVSMARNAGIDKARGKYLLFIDPDDYVETNCLARALKAADDYQAQITFLGYKFLDGNNNIRKEILFTDFQYNVYPGVAAYALSRGDGTTDPDRSVAILFDREFMNKFGIQYIAGIPYLEDGEFLARVLCLADHCTFEGNPFYTRTTREGSATNSDLFYSDKSIRGFIKAACNLKEFSKNPNLNEEQRKFMNQPIAKFTLLAIQACAKPSNWKQLRNVRNVLISKGLEKLSLEGVTSPFLLYGRMYNISIFLFLISYGWENLKTSITVKTKYKVNF